MGYPKERKEAVLKKMLPPNNRPIPVIAREEGISEATLYNWRKAARPQGPKAGCCPMGTAHLQAGVRQTSSPLYWRRPP